MGFFLQPRNAPPVNGSHFLVTGRECRLTLNLQGLYLLLQLADIPTLLLAGLVIGAILVMLMHLFQTVKITAIRGIIVLASYVYT